LFFYFIFFVFEAAIFANKDVYMHVYYYSAAIMTIITTSVRDLHGLPVCVTLEQYKAPLQVRNERFSGADLRE